jgi:transcriptional regulator with XRE-family HTH domain
MSAGRGLRALRKEMGKPIRVVAELAGVSYGNLCEIEREKQSPYIHTVKVIAEANGMDMHRLAHYAFDLEPPETVELTGNLTVAIEKAPEGG